MLRKRLSLFFRLSCATSRPEPASVLLGMSFPASIPTSSFKESIGCPTRHIKRRPWQLFAGFSVLFLELGLGRGLRRPDQYLVDAVQVHVDDLESEVFPFDHVAGSRDGALQLEDEARHGVVA